MSEQAIFVDLNRATPLSEAECARQVIRFIEQVKARHLRLYPLDAHKFTLEREPMLWLRKVASQ